MKNAKHVYKLNNGLGVNVGDVVIIESNNNAYVGDIYDIGEDFIAINLEDEDGNKVGVFNEFFSNIDSIQLG